MIVVDNSVLIAALTDRGARGRVATSRIVADSTCAPGLIDVEAVHVLRRLALSGQISADEARSALSDLDAVEITRYPHRLLVARMWELRDNLSAYDAAYVALAELLDAVLLTADAKMANAPGSRCVIELLS